MNTIIIPTDFSPVSTNAMNYGIEMAKSINANVLLFHVYQVPVSIADTPIVMLSVDELKENAEAALSRVKADVEHVTSGSVKIYTEAKMGNIVDEMEEVCQRIEPFALVMGTKGTTALEKVLFGSTTLTTIKHIKYPVVCVPPGKMYGNGIKKIGFACDFREVVKTTPAEHIKKIASAFNAELHVLNVDHHNRHLKPETTEQSVLLHTLLEEAKPVYHFIENEDVVAGINDFAEKNNLDMIISIPKKHKLLDALFGTNPVKELVFHAHVPVMCIHE